MKKSLNGIELAWEEAGQGPPVVLLHAFPVNRRMWLPQRDALKPRFRVILPDLRGHGESAVPPDDSTMDKMAEDVRALLDELGLNRVVLGGLSMGGYVAFAFLQRYADRVQALVLADTRPGADTEEGRRARYQNAALAEQEGSGAIAERMLPKLLAPPSQQKPELVRAVREMILATSSAGIARALRGMAARPDSTALLPEIRVPTLVIVGEQDGLTPPDEAEAMARKMPNARVARLPGAGHLSNVEQPDAFNQALGEFLARLPG